jgi:hypothetical protein
MVTIVSLWLPILLSSVFVFVASAIVHMALPHHHADHRAAPNEDVALAALRALNLTPGDYMAPHPRNMKKPEKGEKPATTSIYLLRVLTFRGMGPLLGQWFVYIVIVGAMSAYVAGRALGPGAPYLAVFRFAGTAAFLSYAVAMWQDSIWYGRPWGTTIRYTIDGLVYACLTAGTFGWLWPR